jgi:hypothetical protein
MLQSRKCLATAPSASGFSGLFADGMRMNSIRLLALILIIGGVLALAYGSFSYTRDSTAVKLGPVELTVREKETVNVPVWAGIGSLVAGGLLLVFGGKRG